MTLLTEYTKQLCGYRHMKQRRIDRSTHCRKHVSIVAWYKIFCDNSEVTDRSPNGSPNNDKSLNSKEPNYKRTKLSIKHGWALLCCMLINQKKCAHILLLYGHSGSIDIEKHGQSKRLLLENSYLHEHQTKLVDSSGDNDSRSVGDAWQEAQNY